MVKITVFETYQDLASKLGELYQQNLPILKELGQRQHHAETEFRARYGINERIQAAVAKQAEEERQKHPDWGDDETSPSSIHALFFKAPQLVGLSGDERKQFNTEYADFAKGLELSTSIGLLGIGSQYFFQASGVIRPDEPLGVGKNHRSIKGLAEATRNYLQEEQYPSRGATVTPLIYTVREVLPLVAEEHKGVLRQNLEEAYKVPKTEGKKMRDLRLMSIRSLEAMLKEKRSFCGLDQNERDNFVKVYSKAQQK